MSAAMWILRVYNSKGDLMERIHGPDDDLRTQGARITTVRGQRSWRCVLTKDGTRVATCKAGVWRDL